MTCGEGGQEKVSREALKANHVLLYNIIDACGSQTPPENSIVVAGIKEADSSSDMHFSNMRNNSQKDWQLWCRGEAENLHMLWQYLRYCYARAPCTSRCPETQRLKHLLKTLSDLETEASDAQPLPRYEDLQQPSDLKDLFQGMFYADTDSQAFNMLFYMFLLHVSRVPGNNRGNLI